MARPITNRLDYDYITFIWMGTNRAGLDHAMYRARCTELKQDGYPYDYYSYECQCIDMRARAVNDTIGELPLSRMGRYWTKEQQENEEP